MKCKICGANLKKDGDICSNCYKTYQEEEELKKDVNEILKIKRKYSIAYEFSKYAWILIVFVLSFLVCLSSKDVLQEVLLVVIFVFIIGFLFFWDKRIARATQVVFYEKKVVYKFNFGFIHNEKVVKYTDFTDISCYQTFKQKRFGYGDLCIYAKGIFPGATLLNGFQIKNVENAQEAKNIIKEMVLNKKK